jgi:hypothetical protein
MPNILDKIDAALNPSKVSIFNKNFIAFAQKNAPLSAGEKAEVRRLDDAFKRIEAYREQSSPAWISKEILSRDAKTAEALLTGGNPTPGPSRAELRQRARCIRREADQAREVLFFERRAFAEKILKRLLDAANAAVSKLESDERKDFENSTMQSSFTPSWRLLELMQIRNVAESYISLNASFRSCSITEWVNW